MNSTRKWLKGDSESPEASETKSIDARPTRVVQRMGMGCSIFVPEFRVGDGTKHPLPGLPGTDLTNPLAS